MKLYRVEITASAARQMRRLPKADKARILNKIESLATDPLPYGVKKLADEKITYRIRVGDYRIIYEIYSDELIVFVVKVKHRREVYK
jgi:mRNA interferase RelE/StbE